jgi:uncharacterized membrane protein YhaH (DUF805 family)
MVSFLFSPNGRASRSDYWYWLIAPAGILAFIVLVLLPLVLGHGLPALVILAGLFLFFVIHTVIAIKRLHDQSKPGWLVIALILPMVVGAILVATPDAIDFSALERAPVEVRLTLLAGFAAVFGPCLYVLGLIWTVQGKDGVNRYGRDPLYR